MASSRKKDEGEVGEIQSKENKPYVVIAIVILYAWQILNFWACQDLANHYLECRQENMELSQEILGLQQEALNLHQRTLDALEERNQVLESLEDTLEDLRSRSGRQEKFAKAE